MSVVRTASSGFSLSIRREDNSQKKYQETEMNIMQCTCFLIVYLYSVYKYIYTLYILNLSHCQTSER